MSSGKRVTWAAIAFVAALVCALPFMRASKTPPPTAPALGIGSGRFVSNGGVTNFTPLQAPSESYESPAVGLDQHSTGIGAQPAASEPDIRSPQPSPPSEQTGALPPATPRAYESLLSPPSTASSSLMDDRPYRQPLSSTWPQTLDEPPVSRDDRPTKQILRHRIVDGDTLERLAFEYYGDSARADEILAANREVITDPELLRLGVELEIHLP